MSDDSRAIGADEVDALADRSPFAFFFDRAIWMVPCAAVAMVATLPGRTHGLGLVTKPLMEDLGLSSTIMGDINLWGTLIGALFCLPCGWFIDRYGVRSSLTLVLAALATTVLTMSRTEHTAPMFLAVTFTRGFGQSMLSLVSLALIGKWFSGERLGRVMGVYSVLMGIGFAAVFSQARLFKVETPADWRVIWSSIGWALVALAPLAWLLVRDPKRPSQLLQPGNSLEHPVPAAAQGASVWQALAAPCFWTFALASFLFSLISSGISLFGQGIMEERGFDRDVFLGMSSLGFLIGMLANLGGGWLADRLSLRWPMGLAMGLITAALLSFPKIDTKTELYIYTVVMSASGGLVTVVFFSAWGQLFGKAQLGKIQGIAQMLTVLGSALGPRILAWSKDGPEHSYLAIYPTLAWLTGLLAVAVLVTPIRRWQVAADARQPV